METERNRHCSTDALISVGDLTRLDLKVLEKLYVASAAAAGAKEHWSEVPRGRRQTGSRWEEGALPSPSCSVAGPSWQSRAVREPAGAWFADSQLQHHQAPDTG